MEINKDTAALYDGIDDEAKADALSGLYSVVYCPVCGQKTLDNYYICRHCGWEYDYSVENRFSTANRATLRNYRKRYLQATKRGEEGNV